MTTEISRRTALAAALATPLIALGEGRASAVGPGGGCVASSGFFEVGAEGVLIGLLLPAVQRVREAALLVLADANGNVMVRIPVESGKASFFDVTRVQQPGTNDQIIVVRERGSDRAWQAPGIIAVLIGLLLPAVQKNGESAGMLAGSVQVFGDGSVRQLLPFIEQNVAFNLRTGGGADHPGGANQDSPLFVGPFTLGGNANSIIAVLIGLLLPAVQRLRQPHKFVLINSAGKAIVTDSILPAVQRAEGPLFGAQYKVAMGDGSVRVDRMMGDGSVRVGEGASTDGILIALLLPAVRRGGDLVGGFGGSLRGAGMNVELQSSLE